MTMLSSLACPALSSLLSLFVFGNLSCQKKPAYVLFVFQDGLVFVQQFRLLIITAEIDFVFLHCAVVVHPSPADSLCCLSCLSRCSWHFCFQLCKFHKYATFADESKVDLTCASLSVLIFL